MNRLRKKWIALFLVITLFAGMVMPVSAANGVTTADYGALLDSYSAGSGTFKLTTSSRMFVVSETEPKGELLQTAQLINREFAAKGYPSPTPLDLVWGPLDYAKTGDVVLYLDTTSGTGAEGYKLKVTADTATVTATDEDGLLYGANSLMKFFMVDGEMKLTAFTAADTPDTKERTVMLDTGRKYYTVEWICNFIRQISWMGYNSIQVHVSEDGGFRADFWDPAYYKGNFQPENDFTWLCGSHVQSWVKDLYRDDPDAGDYLTTAELVQICEVAKEYHIDIIPSFDSPAHMDYITWKFEQNYKSNNNYKFTYNGTTYNAKDTKGCINYTNVTGYSTPEWPYYTTIDITDGTMAKAFVFALYEDMADFFKEYAGSTDFSIGADEVNLSSSYGPKWNYSQFPGYINELNSMLNGKGYTCRMFNDFIGSTTYNQKNSKAVYDFDDNIEIMYWNSDFDPTYGGHTQPIWHVKFFWETNTGTTDNWGDGGRIMYNCIQTNCYYVLRIGTSGTTNTRDARNPNNRNWTFYHSDEEHIYNEWYPADISEKGDYIENAADVPAEQLGGAYFLIWNDYASLNTEAEVWNGAVDSMGAVDNKGNTLKYSLFDRMYSNIIKMWNSDINTTNNATGMVSFSDFEKVRDVIKTGYFPGYEEPKNGITQAAVLPDAAPLPDYDLLESNLDPKNFVSNSELLYTSESYAKYNNAYQTAKKLSEGYGATAEEIDVAVKNLKTAKEALEICDLTVYYKEKPNTTLYVGGPYKTSSEGTYEIDIDISTVAELEGYKIESISEEAELAQITEDGAKAHITGDIKNNKIHLVVWCEKANLNTTVLEGLVTEKLDGSKYTTSAWSSYTNAIESAKELLNKVNDKPEECTQIEIDTCVEKLSNAREALDLNERATNFSELNAALERKIEKQGDYPIEFWTKYESAIYNVERALENSDDYTQKEIDALVDEVIKAEKALSGKCSIVSIRNLTKQTRAGRPVGLLVKTSEKISNIAIKLENANTNVSILHLSKDTTETFALVKFYAPSEIEDKKELIKYTVFVNDEEIGQEIKVTVVK